MKKYKELAKYLKKCGKRKIKIYNSNLNICLNTRRRVRYSIMNKIIICKLKNSISRYFINKKLFRKIRGFKYGTGKIKGTKNARKNNKKLWILKIKQFRLWFKIYKSRISKIASLKKIYKQIKGNFFRYKKKNFLEVLQII